MGFYIGMFVTSAIYACILHVTRRYWEPDWIWLVVVGGVALVGCWVQAYTLQSADVPTVLTGREAMAWINWRWVYMFLWAGAPIVFWQIGAVLGRRERIINGLIKRVSEAGMATNRDKPLPWPYGQRKRRERVIDWATDGKKELEKILERADELPDYVVTAAALAYAALTDIRSDMIEARYGAPEE